MFSLCWFLTRFISSFPYQNGLSSCLDYSIVLQFLENTTLCLNVNQLTPTPTNLCRGPDFTSGLINNLYIYFIPIKYFFEFKERSIKSSTASRSLPDVDLPKEIASTCVPRLCIYSTIGT